MTSEKPQWKLTKEGEKLMRFIEKVAPKVDEMIENDSLLKRLKECD